MLDKLKVLLSQKISSNTTFYHGSGSKIDIFDLNHIGDKSKITHGWGVYFFDTIEGVKEYKENSSNRLLSLYYIYECKMSEAYLLDWDKPLSEQLDIYNIIYNNININEKLKKYIESLGNIGKLKGSYFYTGISFPNGFNKNTNIFQSKKDASKWLNKLGISGIIYNSTLKSANYGYCIWDENKIKISNKYVVKEPFYDEVMEQFKKDEH
jgi:hypothetical protein